LLPEHLTDVEGLLGYCQEKIKLGHLCLYCEKTSKTWQGCQKHMISKQHGKLRYEAGHWDDLDVFYDFGKEHCEVIPAGKGTRNKKVITDAVMATNEDKGDAMETSGAEDDEEEEEGGWEDVDEDGAEEGKFKDEDDDDEDDNLYGGYEKEIARFGLNVTALGELVFPDGRIVGHRALQRYYKQRPRPTPQGTALLAAQEAAGERMYDGRVVNIHYQSQQHYALPHGSAGGKTMMGAGKGILVSTDKNSKDGGRIMSFSAMSLYRYRAVIRKQRREDVQGRRIFLKDSMNMNRMDKKANNKMNGINMTHCLR
jgi:pre-60S factor REI1